MKLIASLTSPFARKVRIVMAEKHIDCELVLDIPWNADTHVPDYNPLGKIPVLVLDDGTNLFDSRVIAEYLDHASPVGSMLPKESHSRILTKRWEALADGISDAAAAVFLERKRPETPAGNEWIARQQGKVTRGLAAMADALGEHAWCVGERFSLGDIAVGCTLGYIDLRFPEINWRETHPNLARLALKLADRASFKTTAPVI
ncbi:glutathione S-transferase C-terminal domain-containing protein [Sulfuriferula sp.]|uniref:glutathione S-transferase C-terminal domain-containing protein n=1 Tax=Sulfuriferula sp. TaxID=2025307 RepID=UPI002731A54C|nr:glutathione S-transferase C-terminal domain-containing protein [Sulfuriferula sp.]MDP2026680.1 glutathione S-transferase N-terminal domain-containing protein [Sulfuriferula sp.]